MGQSYDGQELNISFTHQPHPHCSDPSLVRQSYDGQELIISFTHQPHPHCSDPSLVRQSYDGQELNISFLHQPHPHCSDLSLVRQSYDGDFGIRQPRIVLYLVPSLWCTPTFGSGGRTHSLAGEGNGTDPSLIDAHTLLIAGLSS